MLTHRLDPPTLRSLKREWSRLCGQAASVRSPFRNPSGRHLVIMKKFFLKTKRPNAMFLMRVLPK